MDKLLQDTVDRFTLNNVDLVVPISSVLRDAMLQRVKSAAAVSEPVPFTVDTKHFSPYPSLPEKVVVGYGGRVSPEKGFPFFAHVMEATPQLSYRLAGPFQMNLGLPDNCHYDGIMSLLDMPGFYAKCSVLALPSFGEGIPGMILEAYACGRPVVVTPESLPPCLPCFGWTVGRDVAEWKRALEGITQGEVQRYGEEARRWVTSQWPSWSDFAVTMREKFEQVKQRK
jgi:glycosyltransferase involved in cell wall biosynthesis